MKNKALRDLFQNADSCSIDDDFIRYINPSEDDEFEVMIILEDIDYNFTSESLDNAKFSNGQWLVFCDDKQQVVDISFYQVTDITKAA